MLAFTHKHNMTASKPDALADMMEDLTKNFQELSFEESFADVQDGRQESVNVFEGKPMKNCQGLLSAAPTNNTQAVDRKETEPSAKSKDVDRCIPMEEYPQSLFTDCKKADLAEPFVRAVTSYFGFHVVRLRKRIQSVTEYMHDNWSIMCRTLDRGDLYMLFNAHIKYMNEKRGKAITTFLFEDMWNKMNEKLIDNEFNWLQNRINGDVKHHAFFNRVQH